MKKLLVTLSLILGLSSLSAIGQNIELMIPTGHTDLINNVALSADGKYVVTCSFDRQVILWDRNTGTQLKAFAQTGDDNTAAAFSPDSKWVAIGSTVRTGFSIHVYDLATGKLAYSTGDGVRATGLYFSRNGNYLVATGWGKALVFFDAKTGREIKAVKWANKSERNHDYRVNTLAVSADERFLALGASDSLTGIIENPFQKLQAGAKFNDSPDYSLSGFSGEVNYCHWSSEGKFLLAQDGGGDAKAWSANTKQELWATKKMPAKSARSFRVAANGRSFSLIADNTLYSYELNTGNETGRQKLDALPTSNYWRHLEGENYLAATGRYGEAIAFVNANTQTITTEMRGVADNGFQITAAKTGWMFGSFDGARPKIWNLQSGQVRSLPNVSDNHILGFSENGKQAIAADGLYELLSGRKSQSWNLPILSANRFGFAWSADGNYIAATGKGSEGRFQVVHVSSGRTFAKNARSGANIQARVSRFSPDSQIVVLGWEDGEVQVVRVASGETIKAFNTKGDGVITAISDLRFSADGSRLFVFAGGVPVGYETTNWSKAVNFTSYKNWQGRQLSVSPDGQFLLASYGGFEVQKCDVVMFDAKTGKQLRVFNGHYNTVRAVAWLPDGKHFLSSGLDHTIRLWNKDRETELCKLVTFANSTDWVAVTPDGHFDGTTKGMEKLYFVRGLTSIPLAGLIEKYYVPGLVMKLVGGVYQPPPPDEDVNKLKAPPLVKIGIPTGLRNLSVEDDKLPVRRYQMTEERISLTVEAQSSDDRITEIRLFQNGKLVGGGTRNLTVVDDSPERSKKQTFEAILTAGENTFTAIALNSERTESQPDAIVVTRKAASNVAPVNAASNLFMLVIGINQYKNAKYNLNYAIADATAFKTTVEAVSAGLYAKVNASFIGDDKATRAGIIAEFEKIKAAAQPNDVFIFYYAGHGVLNEKKEFHLVPHDVTQIYGADDALAQKGLSAAVIQQYSREIKAQKQLFILDACQSAGALQNVIAMRGAAEERAIAQLARATGTHWLTASGSEQFAAEFKQLGHGTFTYVLLDALTGKADKAGDRKVTVKELDAYLQDLVPEISAKFRSNPQYPASFGFGNDFPIGIVK